MELDLDLVRADLLALTSASAPAARVSALPMLRMASIAVASRTTRSPGSASNPQARTARRACWCSISSSFTPSSAQSITLWTSATGPLNAWATNPRIAPPGFTTRTTRPGASPSIPLGRSTSTWLAPIARTTVVSATFSTIASCVAFSFWTCATSCSKYRFSIRSLSTSEIPGG